MCHALYATCFGALPIYGDATKSRRGAYPVFLIMPIIILISCWVLFGLQGSRSILFSFYLVPRLYIEYTMIENTIMVHHGIVMISRHIRSCNSIFFRRCCLHQSVQLISIWHGIFPNAFTHIAYPWNLGCSYIEQYECVLSCLVFFWWLAQFECHQPKSISFRIRLLMSYVICCCWPRFLAAKGLEMANLSSPVFKLRCQQFEYFR